MKKIFCLVLLTLISLSLLSAVEVNNQKVWTNESNVYKAIRTLYLATGHAEPSSSSPFSQEELTKMLDKIDPTTLSDELKEVYDYVEGEFSTGARFNTENIFSGNLRAIVEPEVYLHTNKDDFTSEKDWNYGFKDRSPLLHLEGEGWVTSHFYMDVDFGVGIDYGRSEDLIVNNNNDHFAPVFWMNIPFAFGNADLSQPNKALLSFGGNYWSVALGRGRLNWGNGVTGNLMLSDNVPYHNFFKADVHTPSFKFTFLLSFFPHPGDLENGSAQNSTINGMKAFVGHRFEFRFFRDKMALSLNESMMFQSVTNTFDVRIFNPMYLYHDMYIRGNSNSLMSLEFSYTIFNGFEVYLQAAVDDFPLLEPVEPEQSANPNAFGYILGVKYTTPLLGGILSTSFEAAYTDPFLYLREEYDKTTGQYGVKYDALVRYNRAGAIFYERNYIGYKYGCDALVLDLRADYDRFDKINLNGEFMFISHGVNDINSSWSAYSGVETVPHTPSSQNPFAKGDEAKKNKVEYTFMLSLGGSYNIFPRFKVYGDISMFLTLNKGNMEKAPTFDSQFTLGTSYTFD